MLSTCMIRIVSFYQLFLENVSSIDVTQISTQQGPGAKKRRLESGWCYVLEFLSDRDQHLQMIPWIQLVTRFLEKYPKNFPQELVAPYLTIIANQLGDFKRYNWLEYYHSQHYVFVFQIEQKMVFDSVLQKMLMNLFSKMKKKPF